MPEEENKARFETKAQGVRLKWPLDDNLPVYYANHFALLRTDDEAVLVFGTFLPAGLHTRSEEEVQEYLENATVKPLAKIAMTPAGLEALYMMLKRNLQEEAAEEISDD